MQDAPQGQAKTILIDDGSDHQARVATVRSRTSLGQLLEGAITMKLQREYLQGSYPEGAPEYPSAESTRHSTVERKT